MNVCRTYKARMAKPKKTLSINPVLIENAEDYAEPRQRSLTSVVNEALEEWLKARGIDPFRPKAEPAAQTGRALAVA